MALPEDDKLTALERSPRPGFPIVRVLGMANGMVCALCLTAAYIVRQWRLARQAEIDANERVALMTWGKGGRVRGD
jgi:hypothetical protein